jgi:hypothetical protein
MGLDFPQGTYHISPSRKRRECLGWAERVQVVGLSREREREREERRSIWADVSMVSGKETTFGLLARERLSKFEFY